MNRLVVSLTLILLTVGISSVCSLYAQEPVFGGEVVITDLEPGPIINPLNALTLKDRQKASFLYPRLLRSNGISDRSLVLRIVPRRDEQRLLIYLRDRDTNPVGKLVSPLDAKATLMQFLREKKNTSALSRSLLRITGAADFLNGEAETIRGIETVNENLLVLEFDDDRMIPAALLEDLSLSASRYFDGPTYLATDRGPFYRTEPGILSANLQYIFGRPYLDRILFGAQNDQGNHPDRAVMSLTTTSEAELAEANQQLIFPGKRCVYLLINPENKPLKNPGVRQFIMQQIDAESLVSIFFAERAQVLRRIVPSEYVPFDRIPFQAARQPDVSIVRSLEITYPTGNEDLKLVAERVQVDLLVAKIDSKLTPFSNTPPESADVIIAETLVSQNSPALSLWLFFFSYYGDQESFSPPWIDELAWLLEFEKNNSQQYLLLPLYQSDYSIYLPQRLRGLRFFSDGSLDFEDAWLQQETYDQ